MAFFALNTEFNDWKEVLEAKKLYEENSKSLLFIEKCDKLKGSSVLNDKLVYQRVVLACKAGSERPTTSKGFRASSTYKKNCPVKVRLVFDDNKLIVKAVDLNHRNHLCDQQTFDHYPENLRLNEVDMATAKEMIQVGGNKQKIKMYLSKRSGKPVMMKSLFNIQSEIQNRNNVGQETQLQKLYDILADIPNANTCFITDENDELLGIFYQDERMQHLFAKYPELILFDATYKMNNLNMPLFTQCVVDGNGETEIASLYMCKSESRDGIRAMLEAFQQFNPKWTDTAVIIGDKDFADRSIYIEMFPDAKLQICLYHVLVNFNREITTQKRSITPSQRVTALQIITRLVYSKCSFDYNAAYEELCKLGLDMVFKYYNDNWHVIKEEWTMHGRNNYACYMNTTNNRSERLNRTFKQISNRHASLVSFFGNITTTVAVLASERDIKAIRSTMKVERRRFEDPDLQQ